VNVLGLPLERVGAGAERVADHRRVEDRRAVPPRERLRRRAVAIAGLGRVVRFASAVELRRDLHLATKVEGVDEVATAPAKLPERPSRRGVRVERDLTTRQVEQDLVSSP